MAMPPFMSPHSSRILHRMCQQQRLGFCLDIEMKFILLKQQIDENPVEKVILTAEHKVPRKAEPD